MALFEIKNLTFTYPDAEKPAIENIHLSIEPGEFVVICGKSGCGKTTLMRHFKTVLSPYGKREGEILFCGERLEGVSMRTQSAEIGYVLQSPDNQIVTDKVWHELAFGVENLGYDQQTIRLRVAEMASFFGIQNWFSKNVEELSGGQKQLLNLASVMAMQPKVLVLDEPTSQLDPIAAGEFLSTIRKINLDLGITVIMIEHRLEEVFPMADKGNRHFLIILVWLEKRWQIMIYFLQCQVLYKFIMEQDRKESALLLYVKGETGCQNIIKLSQRLKNKK